MSNDIWSKPRSSLFIGIPSIVFCVGVFIFCFVPGFCSSFWPSVNGEVISSSVANGAGRSGPQKILEVTYKYSVNHRLYVGKKVTFSLAQRSDFFSRQGGRVLPGLGYRPGSPIAVYYESAHPDNSVLVPGLRWYDYLAAGFLVFLGYSMVYLWIICKKYKLTV
ncbi:MAG: DUF3592 domain-containing protein [Candidatus Omnitrophica bacterium]|nr:DUF3592 domain-containing protein [Candidatus Omnitrophota bacterium]